MSPDKDSIEESPTEVKHDTILALEHEMLAKLLPKKSTIKVFWQTLSITIVNLLYFSGGFYLLRYQFNEDGALQDLNQKRYSAKLLHINKTTKNETKARFYAEHPLIDLNNTEFCSETDNKTLCTYILTWSRIMDLSCKANTTRWKGFWVALDFTSTIMSTVGYGYVVPKTMPGRAFLLVYSLGAICLYIIFLGVLGDYCAQGMEKVNFCKCKNVMIELAIKYLTILVVVFGFIALHSYIAYESSREINSEYERLGKESPISNWTEKDSAYYSIISLMTIGFGDLYTAYPQKDQWKALIVFVLVSVGIALFSYGYNTYVAASERRMRYLKAQAEKMARLAANRSLRAAQFAAGKTGAVVGKAGGMVGNVAGKAGGMVGNVAGKAGGMVGNVAGKAGDMVGNVAGKAGGMVGNVAGKAGGMVGNVAGKAGGMVGNVAGKAGGMVGNVAGKTIGKGNM